MGFLRVSRGTERQSEIRGGAFGDVPETNVGNIEVR